MIVVSRQNGLLQRYNTVTTSSCLLSLLTKFLVSSGLSFACLAVPCLALPCLAVPCLVMLAIRASITVWTPLVVCLDLFFSFLTPACLVYRMAAFTSPYSSMTSGGLIPYADWSDVQPANALSPFIAAVSNCTTIGLTTSDCAVSLLKGLIDTPRYVFVFPVFVLHQSSVRLCLSCR